MPSGPTHSDFCVCMPKAKIPAFTLFGLGLLTGLTGTTELARIGQNARSHPSPAAEGPSAATRELLYVLRAAPGHDGRCVSRGPVIAVGYVGRQNGVAVDVADEAQIQALVASTKADHGRIDLF